MYVKIPTQPLAKLVPGDFATGEKRSGSAADFSPPSSTVVKNAWSYAASHSSVKARD